MGTRSTWHELPRARPPAATDLDLFGVGGLFEQRPSHVRAPGEKTLAGWLLTPGSVVDVRVRQAAVAELRDRLDLRRGISPFWPAWLPRVPMCRTLDAGAGAHRCSRRLWRGYWGGSSLFTLLGLLGVLLFDTGPGPLVVALGIQIAFALAACGDGAAVLGPMEKHLYNPGFAWPFAGPALEQERFTSARMVQLQTKLTGAASQGVRSLHRLQRLAPSRALWAGHRWRYCWIAGASNAGSVSGWMAA